MLHPKIAVAVGLRFNRGFLVLSLFVFKNHIDFGRSIRNRLARFLVDVLRLNPLRAVELTSFTKPATRSF